jgi:hypothetical protein
MTGSLYREAALMDDDDDIYRPAGMGGEGWWDDAQKEVKRVAKKVQKSSAVRGVEKRAVKAGADVLRGAATAATDGLADSALASLGVPEFAPLADQLINKGAKSLEKKGVDYLDQKIDASGRGYGGVRYMSPAGGGLRLAGHGTQVGAGLRLAGSGSAGHHRMPDGSLMKNSDHKGRGHCGCGHMEGHGLRLAGSGLRLAGSGMYRQVGLVEGGGHAYC